MSYFLAFSGIPNKFSRNAFLLRWFARHLESSQIELRAVHAVDLEPRNAIVHPLNLDELVHDARAILLLTPVPKDDWGGLLTPLLRLLPGRAFAQKPLMLLGTGGFVGDMQGLERTLSPDLERLAEILPFLQSTSACETGFLSVIGHPGLPPVPRFDLRTRWTNFGHSPNRESSCLPNAPYPAHSRMLLQYWVRRSGSLPERETTRLMD